MPNTNYKNIVSKQFAKEEIICNNVGEGGNGTGRVAVVGDWSINRPKLIPKPDAVMYLISQQSSSRPGNGWHLKLFS